jgi:hypothetical protein
MYLLVALATPLYSTEIPLHGRPDRMLPGPHRTLLPFTQLPVWGLYCAHAACHPDRLRSGSAGPALGKQLPLGQLLLIGIYSCDLRKAAPCRRAPSGCKDAALGKQHSCTTVARDQDLQVPP